mgnify:FL=1
MKLQLDLPALPDLAALGGNARRRASWREQREATRREQEKWWALILQVLEGQPRPKFQRARAKVVLVFAQKRRRDRENLLAALKPLWDVLSSVPPGKEMAAGYEYRLGIIPDDDFDHLDVHLQPPLVELGRAPRTVIVLEDV